MRHIKFSLQKIDLDPLMIRILLNGLLKILPEKENFLHELFKKNYFLINYLINFFYNVLFFLNL